MNPAVTKSEDAHEPVFSIGSAARMLQVSVQTLRLYEREGLILPFKSRTNQRWYSHADIDRIQCIRQAINEQKMSVQGIRRVQAMIPCWEIIGCTESDRQKCPAYAGHSGGCWSYQHKNTVCASRDCRTCPVYAEALDCSRIKQTIIHATRYEQTLST